MSPQPRPAGACRCSAAGWAGEKLEVSDLIERTREFALSALRFIRKLPDTPEAKEAGGQLRRSANGLRYNYRASKKGRSRAEFTAKLGTACEEADECVDWLEYLRDASIAYDAALLQ